MHRHGRRFSIVSHRGGVIDAVINVDPTRTFTTVMLTGDRHAAVGTAKRHPDDPYSAQVGMDIAMARALRDLADKVERHAGHCCEDC